MSRVARLVPWLLMSIIVGVLAFATASLVALERSRPEAMDLPEQVSFLYVHAVPLTFGVVAALVMRSQPRHLEGWAFGLFALMIAVEQVLQVYTSWYPHNETLARVQGAEAAPGLALLALILLLFPDGRPPSRRWRPVAAFLCVMMVLGVLLEAAGSTAPWSETTDAVTSFIGPLALIVIGVVSLCVRWRYATGQTRQQIKWLTLGASVFGIEFALALVLAAMHAMDHGPGSYYVGNLVFVLILCLIPAGMGIGIVRHHLYDVDKLLSRTIAYGLLLVGATGLYLASVAVFAGVLASRSRSPVVLAIATTALAVIALNPARRRVVAWADRRVYGTRTEPAEMMAGVAAELAAYRSPEDGVNGLAEAARRATRARGAVVRIEPAHEVRAGDISAAGARTSVPLRVDGAAVGSITVVDPSRHSEGLKLLSRLAALAAPAAADMRTIAELQQLRTRIEDGNVELAASRFRLARAEEEERAHLRQIVQSEMLPAVLDLQGALPSLEAVRAGDVDLDDAARQARELADRICGLAHDVLPAVLADRGLAAGLRAYVRRLGADVTLTVPESHRLPEPMEAALYICGRLLLDALTTDAGPVAVTLAVSPQAVHLTATTPATIDDLGNKTLRLLTDRLSVLGGDLTTTSFDHTTEISCTVPLTIDPEQPPSARSPARLKV